MTNRNEGICPNEGYIDRIRDLTKEDLEEINKDAQFGKHSKTYPELEAERKELQRQIQALEEKKETVPPEDEDEVLAALDELTESLEETDREILHLYADAVLQGAVLEGNGKEGSIFASLVICRTYLEQYKQAIRKDSDRIVPRKTDALSGVTDVFTEEKIRLQSARTYFYALLRRCAETEGDRSGEAVRKREGYQNAALTLALYLQFMQGWYEARIRALENKAPGKQKDGQGDKAAGCELFQGLMETCLETLNKLSEEYGIQDGKIL